MDYFQRVLPSASDTARSDNEAEWIVNLTTRVRTTACVAAFSRQWVGFVLHVGPHAGGHDRCTAAATWLGDGMHTCHPIAGSPELTS